MFSRTSTRWLVPLLILASFGAVVAYNRISATTSSAAASSAHGQLTTVDAPHKKHHPVVMPKIDWKPGQPWPGEWIKYAADSELPNGLTIEVTQGVVTAVAQDEGDQRDYDILGTRYVVGDLDATDITPALWRSLDLEMPKPDCSIAELTVLRPLWWIEQTGAKPGETVDLGMHEIGISGMAKVLNIGRCEVNSRDNPKGSQIVIGKIKHHNAEVWDLVFNHDTAKPLGVTANHPIYSLDRDDWVPAGELKINEKVRTLDGTATLTSKSKRPGRETVYNLEVHRNHAYHVSPFGILAHNSNVLNCFKVSKVAPDWSTKGFHVHVDGVEIALRPGQDGSVVLKKVFSSTPDSAFNAASRRMQTALGDASVRARLHRDAVRARDYLKGLGDPRSIAKSGELSFLIKALEKMGLQ
jgi:hypothetical protein